MTVASEYSLSNPLSGGEMALLAFTGLIGYGITDVISRMLETTAVASGQPAGSIPTGATVPNDVATSGFPSTKSLGAQAGLTILPGLAAIFIKSPLGRASAQGVMLGAGFHLAGDLFRGLMGKLFHNTNFGKRNYLNEILSQDLVNNAVQSPNPGGTMAGLPGFALGAVTPAGGDIGPVAITAIPGISYSGRGGATSANGGGDTYGGGTTPSGNGPGQFWETPPTPANNGGAYVPPPIPPATAGGSSCGGALPLPVPQTPVPNAGSPDYGQTITGMPCEPCGDSLTALSNTMAAARHEVGRAQLGYLAGHPEKMFPND